jgi:tripartite-type tricarboxylate transporter receptor subunit TctC
MKSFKRFTSLVLALVLILSLAACGKTADPVATNGSGAQVTDWPKKTIQVVVPYNAGGDTDIYCRLAAERLTKILGKQVIIVNIAGSGGILAAKQVMNEEPDGYNILFSHTGGLIQEASGMADFSFAESFESGGTLVEDNTLTMVARVDSGWKNLGDVVAAAKAAPGKVTYSQVNGQVTHFVSKLFEETAGIELDKIDVGASAADRTAAFLGGQVDLLVVNYANIADYVEAGQFVALGVLSPERIATLPDIPTFVEQGYDVVTAKRYSYKFPNGTDQVIIDKFTEALKQVAEDSEFKAELAKFHAAPFYKTPTVTEQDEQAEVVILKEVMGDIFKQ